MVSSKPSVVFTFFFSDLLTEQIINVLKETEETNMPGAENLKIFLEVHKKTKRNTFKNNVQMKVKTI